MRMELLITLVFFCFRILLCKANNTILSAVNDKELLEGLTFRVSSFERAPFLTSRRGEGGRVIRTGVMVDIMETMSEYFQMRLVYVPISPTDVARNGIPTAMIHQLQNDQIDIGNFVFMNILEYLKTIDLSYPIFIDDFNLMQPFPNKTSRLSDPIKPFTSAVWYIFIISNAVFAGVITSVIIYSRQLPSFHEHQGQRTSLWGLFYLQFEYVLKMISSQGSTTPPELKRFISFRLMIALWLLMMVVLNNSYSGIYTANMAVPKLEPTVDTLEELAASNKFRMTIEMNTDIGFKSLEAKSGPFKVFGDTFRRNPELLYTRYLDGISNVIQQNGVYPGAKNLIKYYINADLKSHPGECRLSISKKPLPYYLSYSLGLQKGNPYSKIINQKFVLQMWENGMIVDFMRKYFPPIPARCLSTGRKSGGPTPLKLDDFVGAFVLLLIGYILAKLVFIAELIAHRLSRRRGNN